MLFTWLSEQDQNTFLPGRVELNSLAEAYGKFKKLIIKFRKNCKLIQNKKGNKEFHNYGKLASR